MGALGQCRFNLVAWSASAPTGFSVNNTLNSLWPGKVKEVMNDEDGDDDDDDTNDDDDDASYDAADDE